MQEPRLRQVRGDGITLQLAEWPGAGHTIVCLHGLSANCRWWDTVASGLAPQHRVLAPDLRGRGRSDKPATGYSLAHHGRDIVALLDDLSLDRVVLMGHSLGAFIATAFAARYPERVERVILVDGGGQLSAEQSTNVLAGVQPSVDRLGLSGILRSVKLLYCQLVISFAIFHPWGYSTYASATATSTPVR